MYPYYFYLFCSDFFFVGFENWKITTYFFNLDFAGYKINLGVTLAEIY